MFILIILTSSNEDIIEMVVNGDYHEFEPEKLRGLMKILPEMDEVKLDLNVLMIVMMILIMFCCIDEYILPEMSMSMICGIVFGTVGIWEVGRRAKKILQAEIFVTFAEELQPMTILSHFIREKITDDISITVKSTAP